MVVAVVLRMVSDLPLTPITSDPSIVGPGPTDPVTASDCAWNGGFSVLHMARGGGLDRKGPVRRDTLVWLCAGYLVPSGRLTVCRLLIPSHRLYIATSCLGLSG